MWRRSSFRFLGGRRVELALVVLWDTDSEGSRERRGCRTRETPTRPSLGAQKHAQSEGVFLVYKEPGCRGLVRF